MQKLAKYLPWVASILVALPLVAFGGAKLMGVPAFHQSFAVLGLPSWFGYFIGACEVAGAIGLLIRPLAAWAAAGIAVIAAGAVYYHVAHPPLGQGVPALAILLLSLYLFFERRRPAAADTRA